MNECNMNICLGGPWHGSQILKCPGKKGWFCVKDSSGNSIKYIKKQIKIGDKLHFFWVESNLTFLQIDVMIDKLLYRKKSQYIENKFKKHLFN